MKKIWLILAGIILAAPAWSQTEVHIAGFGGNDASIVNRLLREVVQPQLDKEKIVVKYQPVEGDFSQFILNALSAGTAPDLFYIDVFWSRTVFKSGKLATLENEYPASRQEQFLPNLMKAFTYQGKLYGIPKDFNTLAIQYNKDIFSDAEVDPPNDNDTWEGLEKKLIAVRNALKEDDVHGLCVVADFARFGAVAFATGWQPFDSSGRTILDQEFRRAFEWYTGLVKSGAAVLAQDIGQGWTGGCFGTEQVAISIEGAWMSGFLRDQAPNLEYGTTLLPKDSQSGKRGNFIYTVSWSLNGDTKNKAEVLRTLEALTSEPAQQWVLEQGLALPSRVALSNNPYFEKTDKESVLNRYVYQGASDGHVYPYEVNGWGNDWLQIVNNALSSVLLGEADVDSALTTAQQALDRLTGHK